MPIASYLLSNAERVITHTGLNFEPEIDYVAKLPSVVAAFQAKMKAPLWNSSHPLYVLRIPRERFLTVLGHSRLGSQSLGLYYWYKNYQDYARYFQSASETLGVRRINRLGFKVVAFLPVKLTHAEIRDLMLGNILAPAKSYENLCGTVDDFLVQLHGRYKNLKTVLVLAPMTKEQASQTFGNTPNLDQFQEDKLDTAIRDFHVRLDGDFFHVDLDIFQEDAEPKDVAPFFATAMAGAEEIVETAVNQLTGLGKKRA